MSDTEMNPTKKVCRRTPEGLVEDTKCNLKEEENEKDVGDRLKTVESSVEKEKKAEALNTEEKTAEILVSEEKTDKASVAKEQKVKPEEHKKPEKSIDKRDNTGKTKLYSAVETKDMVRLAVLLREGADLNLGTKSDLTPLHEAALRGYEDVCAVLLGANADVNVQNKWLDTPLHLATMNGHMRVVEMLVECGADIELKNEYGNTACDDAVKHGQQQIARYLKISADMKRRK